MTAAEFATQGLNNVQFTFFAGARFKPLLPFGRRQFGQVGIQLLGRTLRPGRVVCKDESGRNNGKGYRKNENPEQILHGFPPSLLKGYHFTSWSEGLDLHNNFINPVQKITRSCLCPSSTS